MQVIEVAMVCCLRSWGFCGVDGVSTSTLAAAVIPSEQLPRTPAIPLSLDHIFPRSVFQTYHQPVAWVGWNQNVFFKWEPVSKVWEVISAS